MTRIARYRGAYVACIALFAAVTFTVTHSSGGAHAALFTVILLFIPGRIQGLLYRDLFQGQRALAKEQPDTALIHFNKFLERLEAQPWRKWVLWLSWSIYTPSAKAMGLNNVGAALAAKGQIDSAEAAWRQAIAIDPLYSIPHANLAATAAGRGEADLAKNLLSTAATLGYTGGALDRATHRVQQLLAQVESHGPSV